MNTYLLQHLLKNSYKKFPKNKAIIFEGTYIDYSALEKKSNQLSRLLSEFGIGKGHRVAIMMSKSIEAIISIFGILKTGATYVPIDPKLPVNRFEFIFENCVIKSLITSEEWIDGIDLEKKLYADMHGIIILDRKTNDEAEQKTKTNIYSWSSIGQYDDKEVKAVSISDSNPAYILFTSGTTGIPKGVVISHLNSLAFINMAVDYFKIDKEDKIACHAPLHFDLSVFDIYTAISCGATVVLVPEYYATFPIKIAEYINSNRISVWNSVSSALVLLASRENISKMKFTSLRLIHFSGDIMPIKYLRTLSSMMPNAVFFNIYGQSEANSSLRYKIETIHDNPAWKIPIGKAFPNFEVFALNENNEVMSSSGEEGELYIKSSTVAQGYWLNEELTNEKFICDPSDVYSNSVVYRSGDIVTLDEDNNYVFVGRKDTMIKSRGYRIELDEIEGILNNHSSVKQAAALAVPDEMIGHKIIACVSVEKKEDVDEIEIKQHCIQYLPSYMVPETFILTPSLPRTSTGKIDRNKIKKDFISKK